MADNSTLPVAVGTEVFANDDISSVKYPRVKVTWGPDGTANDADVASGKPLPVQHRVSDGTAWTYGAGAVGAGSPRVTLASDDPAVAALGTIGGYLDTVETKLQAIADDIVAATISTVAHDAVGTGVNPLLQGGYASAAAPSDVSADGDAVRAWRLRNGASAAVLTAAGALIGGDAANGLDVDVTRLPALAAGTATIGGAFGFAVTCSTDITRPADTNAYIANDAWANSTSAPTSGGFTLTSAGRISGGSGIITDIFILSSAVPGTLLQGQLHIFDAAVTEINDNAAFALSDADAKLAVAVVPFTLVANASNSYYHAQNLNIGFTCVGTANLRYLVKVINAYTPISGEVLTVRAKIIQSN